MKTTNLLFKVVLLMSLLGSSAVLFSFLSFKTEKSTSLEEHVINVIYSTSSGYTGWMDKITIYDNGTIRIGKLSQEELAEFHNLILKADVFGLEDEYTCRPRTCP
jgi:hypothetical protein